MCVSTGLQFLGIRCCGSHLLGKSVNLLRRQASVGEHSNLGSDVGPIVLAAKLLEAVLQDRPHGDDPVGHLLDLPEPLLVEGLVVENFRRNARSVYGRVGVHRTNEDLDLRIDALLLLGGFSQDREGADTLAVETLHHHISILYKRIDISHDNRVPTMFLAND